MFLRNAWYAAAESAEIGTTPIGRLIVGDPVVLYRAPDGSPVALADRCAHRRAPLHKGRVVGAALQCGYHGFVFDRSGACIEIPGSQVRPPVTARVRSYPVCERYRYVWIWPGDPQAADPAAVPDLHTNDDPAWAATGERMPIAADYMLFIDNLLDLSHVAFVHRGTIGSDDSAAKLHLERADEKIRLVREAIDIPTPPIYLKQGFGPRAAQRKVITYIPPATVTIDITTREMPADGAPPREKHILIINLITPETERTSHYFWASTRDFDIADAQLTEFFHRETHKAFLEDKDILEAQQRCIDLDPGAPDVLVGFDVGPIQARKLMTRLLEKENSPSCTS
jgi:phenylpropionate dioxygenase-like ring-hydroxylating dioxygenase large terminal subunit